MRGHCSLIAPNDLDQFDSLINDTFKVAPDFEATRQSLSPTFPNGTVHVGAFDDTGRLVSGLRACVVHSARELELYTELWTRMPPLMPTLLLKHAATALSHQQLGLNSLLRYHLVRSAELAGVASTCGLMIARGSRARALSEVGYAAFGAVDQVDGLVARHSPWRLFVLDLSTRGALTRLRSLTSEVGKRYPWRGDAIAWSLGPTPRGPNHPDHGRRRLG